MKGKRTGAALLIAVLILTMAPVSVFGVEGIVDETDTKYSYEDMKRDLKELAERYPEQTGLESLGKTADKRDIYCLRLGNPQAKKQIILQGCMHAREWLNCQVLMKTLERYLKSYHTGTYKGKTYARIFDQVAVYAVPMVNPDGVTISQYGISRIKDKSLRARLKKMSRRGSWSRWKANGRGVDLNRNFPASWGRRKDRKAPASEGYQGKKAGSERETKAVMGLIKRLPNLKACISYHSRGEIIYWGAKGTGSKRTAAYRLAKTVKSMCGYSLVDESKAYGAGGDLERYLIAKIRIPYVCIETGREETPLKHKDFKSIYRKHKTVLERTASLYL